MRGMLTGSVVALVAAGLLAAIFPLRPDIPFTQGSAPASRSTEPSTPAGHLSASSGESSPRTARPTSADPHGATIRPDGAPPLDTGGKWMNAYLLLLTLGHYRTRATADHAPAVSHVEKQAHVGGGSSGLDRSGAQKIR